MGTIFSESVQTFENPLAPGFEEGSFPDSLCAAIYDLKPICIMPRALGVWVSENPMTGSLL